MNNETKISRTAEFMVDGPIEIVFPLFDPFNERKWADGWNPELIHPDTEVVEEGTTFKVKGGGDSSEPEYFWRLNRLGSRQIEYLVTTINRQWTIKVSCTPADDRTRVAVTYTYIAFNERGMRLNKASLDKMYSEDLKDWGKAVNYYLETGELLVGGH